MSRIRGCDRHVGRRLRAVVRDPFLPEDVASEVVIQRGARVALRVQERVRRRAEADDGFAGFDVGEDLRELIPWLGRALAQSAAGTHGIHWL